MKRILSGFVALLLLCACSKMEINSENILGTWVEEYSDYPYFAPDGFATYTFKDNMKVDIHISDAFAGDSDKEITFAIEDGQMWLNPEMSDWSGEPFIIVKLTKKEMEWQRVGTSFSKGTVGSDFKHFVRK